MAIAYLKLSQAIASSLSVLEKLSKIYKQLSKAEQKNLTNALKEVEEATRKTIDNIESDYQKYSNREIAVFWKDAGAKLNLIPNMAEATHWIFQKELYYRDGRSTERITDPERIEIRNMLNLIGRLREKLDEMKK